MGVSAAISIGLPVVLFIVWRNKYKLKAVPMLTGAAAFVLFAMILEQILHSYVLSPNADGSDSFVRRNTALFIIYGVLAAGIFEETARFIAFYILKRKYKGIGTGLSYGIGHGGIEAVLIAGLAMISMVALSVMVNNGTTGGFGDSPAVHNQIDLLKNSNPVLFLASGFERIIAVTVHISLSMLVWCAVTVKGKTWLYPAAILLHAVVNVPAVMYQSGIITNVWLVELLFVIPTAALAYFAYKLCNTMNRADVEDVELNVEKLVEENTSSAETKSIEPEAEIEANDNT